MLFCLLDMGKPFEGWKEQFEMVAALAGWDEQTNLVQLTTQVKDQAYSFYCCAQSSSVGSTTF